MLINDVKKLLLDNNMTMTELASKLAEVQGREYYTVSNFSQKLTKETISHKEILQIADILGYRVIFVKKK